jgi:hypothetical protein
MRGGALWFEKNCLKKGCSGALETGEQCGSEEISGSQFQSHILSNLLIPM